MYPRSVSKNRGAGRTGEAGKRAGGWLAPSLLALFFLAQCCYWSVLCLRNLNREFAFSFSSPLPGFAFRPEVVRGLLLIFLFLFVANLAANLAGSEMTRPEWDLEWLAALPIPPPALIGARIIEKALTNSTGWLVFLPLSVVTSWFAGWGVLSFLLGISATLFLLFTLSLLELLLEFFLRRTLPAPQLRNIKALGSIFGVIFLYLALSMCMPAGHGYASFLYSWILHTPGALLYSPSGAPVGLLVHKRRGGVMYSFVWALVLLALESLIVTGVVRAILQKGFVMGGSRESGRRRKSVPARNPDRAPRFFAWFDAIQAKEVKLLLRDRNFMAQTMVLPFVMIGAQLLFNRGLVEAASRHSSYMAILAFGIAAYTLMFSAFQSLGVEGGALWLLYCFPQPLERLILRKSRLWAGIALIYSIAVFAVGIGLHGLWSRETMYRMTLVLMAIPIYALIGSCLGVFSFQPLESLNTRRMRTSFLYLYMFLISLFAYAIFVRGFWSRMEQIVLTALLSLALWQKVKDRIPYLLDPTAVAPAEVSLADGLIAAMLFFVIQGVVVLIGVRYGAKNIGFTQWLAFLIAGALTFGVFRLGYWRTKPGNIARFFDSGKSQGIGFGLAMGTAALGFGFVYLEMVAHLRIFSPQLRGLPISTGEPWLLALAVVFTPVFEEFIFRGLIYSGLRRTLGVGASVAASAAIFALVYPAPAAIPVFFLGVCAALSFERSQTLLAPVLVHAIYNAGILCIRHMS